MRLPAPLPISCLLPPPPPVSPPSCLQAEQSSCLCPSAACECSCLCSCSPSSHALQPSWPPSWPSVCCAASSDLAAATAPLQAARVGTEGGWIGRQMRQRGKPGRCTMRPSLPATAACPRRVPSLTGAAPRCSAWTPAPARRCQTAAAPAPRRACMPRPGERQGMRGV